MSKNSEGIERRALSVGEAAKAYGLSRATLYRALGDGRLKSVKVGARRPVRPEAMEQLLDLEAGAAK